MSARTIKLAVLGILVLFIGVPMLMGSWYTVPEGFRGVITRNGAVVGIATPGLGFKVPLIDGVTDMSVQTQAGSFEGVAAYSKDIQQATSHVTVNYRLSPDVVQRMYSEVGTEYGAVLITARVQKHVKEVFGKYIATDIINKRDELSTTIQAALAGDLAPFGVVVEAVQIANIDFSDTYEAAAESAATAQAQVVKARQELAKIEVDAQQKVAQANAEATAIKVTADANAYSVEVAGKATASAIKARGDALKDNPDLVHLITAEKWNGALPATMIPGGTIPFLNVGSLQ
jgi:regulator of protease activity HflC (stomatin/prohibitin superfamily)